MPDVMTVSREGAIARIDIARADRGNMLTLDMLDELSAAIRAAGADREVKAIVLRTAGADFCLGRDPASSPEHTPRNAVEMREALTAPILGFYDAVRGAEVPVVAAVQGRAFGFGCAAAAVCDVTIAAHDARFSLPEMKHDLPPTAAISAHLDRSMPKAVAWLVYSTDEIDAETARLAGFVSHVVPSAQLAAETDRVVETLASRGREALYTCKTYIARARLMDTGTAANYAGNLLALVMASKG